MISLFELHYLQSNPGTEMNRLGYDPNKFTYSLYPTNKCECGNNCRAIMALRNESSRKEHLSLKNAIYRAIPVFGPFERQMAEVPATCAWCDVQIFYRYKWTVCPALDDDARSPINRCVNCQLIINRMYEYWEDRHPLFKDLSPDDYLKTEIREQIITAKCKETRKKLSAVLLTMCKFLPKDPAMEILAFQLKLLQKEYRLPIEDFSS